MLCEEIEGKFNALCIFICSEWPNHELFEQKRQNYRIVQLLDVRELFWLKMVIPRPPLQHGQQLLAAGNPQNIPF